MFQRQLSKEGLQNIVDDKEEVRDGQESRPKHAARGSCKTRAGDQDTVFQYTSVHDNIHN